jgi:hypothetical protein
MIVATRARAAIATIHFRWNDSLACWSLTIRFAFRLVRPWQLEDLLPENGRCSCFSFRWPSIGAKTPSESQTHAADLSFKKNHVK